MHYRWAGITTFVVDPGLLTSDSDGEPLEKDLLTDLLVVVDFQVIPALMTQQNDFEVQFGLS